MHIEEKRRKKKKKITKKHQVNEMGNNTEVHDERGSLIKTCCFGEAILTFKATKKCMMCMRPW
jgi:hypothetical protein